MYPALPQSLLSAIFFHGRHVVPLTEQRTLTPVIEKEFLALDSLQQNVLLLKYRNRLSQQVIAKRLHTPLSVARRQQARALHILRVIGNPAYASAIKRLKQPTV